VARREAIDLLVQVPTERAYALLDATAGRGPDIVRWYVELAGIERGATRLKRLEKAAESEHAGVRQLAARFAAPGATALSWQPRALVDRKRREQVEPLLRTALMDVDPGVRREAVRSAALLGLDVRNVAHALTRDAHPQVRIAAAGYLGLRGG